MAKDCGALPPATCGPRPARDSLPVRLVAFLATGSRGAAAITIVYRLYGDR